jgi:hypothetical protein
MRQARSVIRCLATVILSLSVGVLTSSVSIVVAATQPMTIAISTPDSIIKRGDDVQVNIIYSNTSNRTFRLTTAGEIGNRIIVHDAAGGAVPKTPYGKLIYGEPTGEDTPYFGTLAAERPIAPGDQLRDVLMLNKVYKMDRAGAYVIQIARKLPKEIGAGMAYSNKIIVTVTQ